MIDPSADATATSHHSPQYRPEIDGLRAIAVVVVMINHLHSEWLPGGFLGVDLFFVISGYVVTASLVRRREANGWRMMLAGFYARRFRRLLPALLTIVVIVSIVFTMFVSRGDDAYSMTIRTGLSSLVGLSNLYLFSQGDNYFGVGPKYNAFLHTWSLGVEEQFYLFWPLLFILCGVGFKDTSQRNIRILLAVIIFLAIGSFSLYLDLQPSLNTPASFYLMPARFWELAAGAVVFLLQALQPGGVPHVFSRFRSLLDWAFLGCLLTLIVFPVNLALAWKPVFVLAASGIVASLRLVSPLGRLLSLTPFLLIGAASYSLYLWHWPLIVLLRWTLGLNALTILPLLAGIAVASGLSFVFEKRFRYGKSSAGIRRPLFMYPCATLLTGGFVFAVSRITADYLYLGNSNISPENFSVQRSVPGTPITTFRCFLEPNAPIASSSEDSNCQHRSYPNHRTIYLEGDSLAHSMVPLLEKLHRSGFNVSFFSRGGCGVPFTKPWPDNRHLLPRYQACGQHSEQRVASLLRRIQPGDALVLVNANSYVWGDKAKTSYRHRISELAQRLQEKQAELILFSPLPVFSERPKIQAPLSLCFLQWFRPDRAIPYECRQIGVPRAVALEIDSAMRRLQLQLEAKHSNIHVFDPFPILCPAVQGRCSTHLNDQMMFADGIHLTHAGAVVLYPNFRDALKAYGVYPQLEPRPERKAESTNSPRSSPHSAQISSP